MIIVTMVFGEIVMSMRSVILVNIVQAMTVLIVAPALQQV